MTGGAVTAGGEQQERGSSSRRREGKGREGKKRGEMGASDDEPVSEAAAAGAVLSVARVMEGEAWDAWDGGVGRFAHLFSP